MSKFLWRKTFERDFITPVSAELHGCVLWSKHQLLALLDGFFKPVLENFMSSNVGYPDRQTRYILHSGGVRHHDRKRDQVKR